MILKNSEIRTQKSEPNLPNDQFKKWGSKGANTASSYESHTLKTLIQNIKITQTQADKPSRRLKDLLCNTLRVYLNR